MLKHPKSAILTNVLIGAVAMLFALHCATDKGSVIVLGIGAMGQVITAVLLYYLTRDQLHHAKSEASYRRSEQKISKFEHRLEPMTRTHVAYNNAKTGIGKTIFDMDQLGRLHSLRDDMRSYFGSPASTDFNKMCSHAKSASQHIVGSSSYLEYISSYADLEKKIYNETRRQIDALRSLVTEHQQELENVWIF